MKEEQIKLLKEMKTNGSWPMGDAHRLQICMGIYWSKIRLCTISYIFGVDDALTSTSGLALEALYISSRHVSRRSSLRLLPAPYVAARSKVVIITTAFHAE